MREALPKEELRSIYARIAERYDLEHALITARADQKGRKLLVESTVSEGDTVLDCGSGTGTTGIMAANMAGPTGKVVLFDLSEAMLAVARDKARREGLLDRLSFQSGDMVHLPFPDESFDVVLSTYSLCPLYDPANGALELYRVAKTGGRIGVAHSVTPRNPAVKWLAERVEDIAWHFPWLSMGCRSVCVLPALRAAGARVVFSKRIGMPLWPFLVFVVEKPAAPGGRR
jgi:demethylmenaquinone methyltransferase/2-methoxy-6-polyprenyl-1,4-benzoquinol methylase